MNLRPEAIIHCAAYTAVDKAEEDIEVCYQINAGAVKVISECAKELDINRGTSGCCGCSGWPGR